VSFNMVLILLILWEFRFPRSSPVVTTTTEVIVLLSRELLFKAGKVTSRFHSIPGRLR